MSRVPRAVCYLARVIPFDVLVGGIECVVATAVVVGGVVAGIKYGTQDKEYWT